MNKYVYLFELDSVRNSCSEEVSIGQNALFEEILFKGNTVVVTYNQLVDSEAFLCSIKDEKTYSIVLELFKLGAIKLSRFDKEGTPSQYMQNRIERCLTKTTSNKSVFVFSALPVLSTETELLISMNNTLKYSDYTIFERLISEQTDDGEKERYQVIFRVLRIVLQLSVVNLSCLEGRKVKGEELTDYLMRVDRLFCVQREHIYSCNIGYNRMNKLLLKAMNILKDIYNSGNQDNQHRSSWVNHILQYPDNQERCMAEAIVDLCYNYVLENSINGIDKHYSNDNESFQKDFTLQLIKYWNSYKKGIHTFCRGEKNEINKLYPVIPEWTVAYRMIEDEVNKTKRFNEVKAFIFNRIDNKKEGKKLVKASLNNHKNEYLRWNLRLYINSIIRIMALLCYVVVFCIADILVGALEGLEITIMSIPLVDIALKTVVFGVISAVISWFFHLPDILDSITGIGKVLKDIMVISRHHVKKLYEKMVFNKSSD